MYVCFRSLTDVFLKRSIGYCSDGGIKDSLIINRHSEKMGQESMRNMNLFGRDRKFSNFKYKFWATCTKL